MKIYLPRLKEGVPLEVEESYEPKKLDVEFVDLKYTKPLTLTGTVEKGPVAVVFRGHMRSVIRRVCGRCLKEIDEDLDVPFELFYEIKGKVEINTLDDLREQLMIDHPLVFLCQANCKGLCPTCGLDLNETSCDCPKDAE